MTRRAIGFVAVLAALGACAGASSSHAVIVGLADQHAASFADERLTSLPVRHARLAVPWDGLRYGFQRREMDNWMRTTTKANMTVLVTFGRSRVRPFSLPAPAEYRAQVQAFMRRYRHVREYSPWNEPNQAIHPRNYDPARIATYYRTLRTLCPRCKVLGADVVDNSSLDSWMKLYLQQFPAGRAPKFWGLHNYVDVNSVSRWGTIVMLRRAPGEIWFTETGAIVSRKKPRASARTDRRKTIRTGESRSAAATQRVFTLAAMSERITRVYIYHWRAGPGSSWDSALFSEDGTPRPSFDVFASEAEAAAPDEPE
jgi:hypothetical protein